MSVSIKVSVRCRPFTCDDRLGVLLTQSGEEEGEVQLLNSTYSTTRFGFSYAWWSAYGYQRHVLENPPEVDQMTLVDQQAAYDSVGLKIKSDLLSGNAVVLFAYGLSGSGKTFTVFGVCTFRFLSLWHASSILTRAVVVRTSQTQSTSPRRGSSTRSPIHW